ncbi:hypothetical protein TCON_0262 [Astathelohania contejeani]|uniref:Uncharacterized protein n=1 Tax=Astathelohania contejeani TaxID=164912 RepID=A0ABQ7I2A3_9MICR|nr:hypothetical protein TCON_0262 [Thelohania contejeani]
MKSLLFILSWSCFINSSCDIESYKDINEFCIKEKNKFNNIIKTYFDVKRNHINNIYLPYQTNKFKAEDVFYIISVLNYTENNIKNISVTDFKRVVEFLGDNLFYLLFSKNVTIINKVNPLLLKLIDKVAICYLEKPDIIFDVYEYDPKYIVLLEKTTKQYLKKLLLKTCMTCADFSNQKDDYEKQNLYISWSLYYLLLTKGFGFYDLNLSSKSITLFFIALLQHKSYSSRVLPNLMLLDQISDYLTFSELILKTIHIDRLIYYLMHKKVGNTNILSKFCIESLLLLKKNKKDVLSNYNESHIYTLLSVFNNEKKLRRHFLEFFNFNREKEFLIYFIDKLFILEPKNTEITRIFLRYCYANSLQHYTLYTFNLIISKCFEKIDKYISDPLYPSNNYSYVSGLIMSLELLSLILSTDYLFDVQHLKRTSGCSNEYSKDEFYITEDGIFKYNDNVFSSEKQICCDINDYIKIHNGFCLINTKEIYQEFVIKKGILRLQGKIENFLNSINNTNTLNQYIFNLVKFFININDKYNEKLINIDDHLMTQYNSYTDCKRDSDYNLKRMKTI